MYYYIHRNTNSSSSSADSFVAASLSSACYIKDSSQPLQQATFFPWNRNAAAAPDLRFDPWCPQGQAVTNNVAWFSSSNLPAGIILNSSSNYYCGCTSVQDRYALEFMTFAKTDFLRRHSMQLIDRNKLLLFAFSLVTPNRLKSWVRK